MRALTIHSLPTHHLLTAHSLPTRYSLSIHSLPTQYSVFTIHSVFSNVPRSELTTNQPADRAQETQQALLDQVISLTTESLTTQTLTQIPWGTIHYTHYTHLFRVLGTHYICSLYSLLRYPGVVMTWHLARSSRQWLTTGERPLSQCHSSLTQQCHTAVSQVCAT